MRVLTGYFVYHAAIPVGWFHLGLVFHGSQQGQGFTLHVHQQSTRRSGTLNSKEYQNTTGTVIIGRRFHERDQNYGSITMDELTLWNRKLSQQDVEALRNMYHPWSPWRKNIHVLLVGKMFYNGCLGKKLFGHQILTKLKNSNWKPT